MFLQVILWNFGSFGLHIGNVQKLIGVEFTSYRITDGITWHVEIPDWVTLGSQGGSCVNFGNRSSESRIRVEKEMTDLTR